MSKIVEYKDLNKIKSYSEQGTATIQWAGQIRDNEEWLKRYCEKLEYLTPPAIRKRFNPILLDKSKSWGCDINEENNCVFSNTTSDEVFVDFNNTDLIDSLKTNAVIHSRIKDGYIIKSAETPQKVETVLDKSTRSWSPWVIKNANGEIIGGDMTCNEFWYVGFDKNREYALRPNWLANELNNEIPSIGRAQTFKPNISGVLESVVLNIQASDGQDKHNTASPLIVQIRKTVNKNGVAYPEELACDYNGEYTVLAEQKIRFSNNSPNVVSITFDHPCNVEANETYAIVVLSPLSHPEHCYYMGGWNKHCDADAYADGDAFYTFNNGLTWIRYGKDDDVEYHQGKYAPQDFAFQCHIRKTITGYQMNKEHYLYLKPIHSNPVEKVTINADDNISDNNVSIKYQVSNNGIDWYDISKNHSVEFETAKHVTFIRACMKMLSNGKPATIDNITVYLTTKASTEMYARGEFYYPKLNPMLGARVWGRIYAPFEVDSDVHCNVEIIEDKEVIEHFTVIHVNELIDYIHLPGIDENKIIDKSDSKIVQYLEDNSSVVELLKSYQIYVLPWSDENNIDHSFFDKFEFKSSPAYPLISCTLQPKDKGEITRVYGEWYDFVVDYDNDLLCWDFYDEDYSDDVLRLLKEMPSGTFDVRYNPLFIDRLSVEEVGRRSEDDEGLILDYFKETFTIQEDTLEDRSLKLRCAPVDPIRKVILKREGADDLELIEDIDYTMDYDNKELLFEIVNTDGISTILNVNDIVEVVYTPNLEDTGISIAYHASRENTDNQCRILPNYIEYK